MSYNRQKRYSGAVSRNESREGQPMEKTWKYMMEKGDAKASGKEQFFPHPDQGIPYGTNIRDNKFDKAISQVEKVNNSVANWRKKKAEAKVVKLEPKEGEKGAQATSE